MSGALLELMEPLIRQKEAEAWEKGNRQGASQGIQRAVCALRSLGHSDKEIKNVLIIQYDLPEETAEEYLVS